jgi:hypothetical protein
VGVAVEMVALAPLDLQIVFLSRFILMAAMVALEPQI